MSVVGEKGAMRGYRRSCAVERHEPHHCGPDTAAGMLQVGMKTQCGRDLEVELPGASGHRSRRAFLRLVAMPARSQVPLRCVPRRADQVHCDPGAEASWRIGLQIFRTSPKDRERGERQSHDADRSPRGSAPALCRPSRRCITHRRIICSCMAAPERRTAADRRFLQDDEARSLEVLKQKPRRL